MARNISESPANLEQPTLSPEIALPCKAPSAWPQIESRVSPASLAGLSKDLLCYRVSIKSQHAPAIWLIRESQSAEQLLELALASRLLSQSERNDVQQMQNTHAAARKAIARALLRAVLSTVVDNEIDPQDWVITYDDYGKPCVQQQKLDKHFAFSVSHTEGLIVCAIHATDHAIPRGNLGVDVEPLTRQVSESVSRKAMHAAERQLVRTDLTESRQQSLLRLWTLKEAWSKAIGLGLQSELSRAEFHCRAETIEMTSHHRSGVARERSRQGDWTFAQWKVFHSHWIALAIQDTGLVPKSLQR